MGWGSAVAATAPTPGYQGPLSGRRGSRNAILDSGKMGSQEEK